MAATRHILCLIFIKAGVKCCLTYLPRLQAFYSGHLSYSNLGRVAASNIMVVDSFYIDCNINTAVYIIFLTISKKTVLPVCRDVQNQCQNLAHLDILYHCSPFRH